MTRRLQIGEFSRLTQIPVKTLRYYADEGLLEPDYVDHRTSYRYYSVDQIGAATRILNLRVAGVSLHDIRRLEGENAGTLAAAAAALGQQRRKLEHERAKIEAQLDAVDLLQSALSKVGPAALTDLRFRILEPDYAFVAKATLTESSDELTGLFEQAEVDVARVGARADKAPYSIERRLSPASPEKLVCIPVRDDAVDRLDAELVGETCVAVSATFQGPYEGSPLIRAKIDAFLSSLNAQPALVERTVYHRFGADQVGYTLPKQMIVSRSADFVTEIQIPVRIEGN